MSEADKIAQGLSHDPLAYMLALALLALAGMFWMLMKQRDRFEASQEEHKKELVALHERHGANAARIGAGLRAVNSALGRILVMVSHQQPPPNLPPLQLLESIEEEEPEDQKERMP